MSKIFTKPFNPLPWNATPQDFAKSVADVPYMGIYTAETIQRYVYGTRYLTWDGRVFKYGYCGSTLESMKYFVFNQNRLVAEKTSPSATVGTAVAGDTALTLTVSAGTIGAGRTGIIAEDALAGGFISMYQSSSDRSQRMIVGNDALAVAETSFKIYLEAPVMAAVTALTATEICANPYSDLRRDFGGYASAMGMPCVVAATADNFWIQSWGICRVTPDSTVNAGHGNNRRQFYVDQYGVSQMPTTYDEAKANRQAVGFVVERTGGISEDAAPFVMLQISI